MLEFHQYADIGEAHIQLNLALLDKLRCVAISSGTSSPLGLTCSVVVHPNQLNVGSEQGGGLSPKQSSAVRYTAEQARRGADARTEEKKRGTRVKQEESPKPSDTKQIERIASVIAAALNLVQSLAVRSARQCMRRQTRSSGNEQRISTPT